MIGNTIGFKQGQKPWNYGKKMSKELKTKLSKSHLGKKLSIEHKENIGKSGRGKIRSDESKLKLSLSKRGTKNPAWNGGSSLDKYGHKFTSTLKSKIRNRDNYTCQECNTHQDELGYLLPVHHIDYDKHNNSETNLISLCRKCHGKTNFSRDDWLAYFNKKLK